MMFLFPSIHTFKLEGHAGHQEVPEEYGQNSKISLRPSGRRKYEDFRAGILYPESVDISEVV